MRKRSSASQRTVNHIRTRIRHDMERLALTHKGCNQARGCGCLVDLSLTILSETEQKLFQHEIDSYANPKTPRRIVDDDGAITTPDGEQG